MPAVPSSIALINIPDGAPIIAADHRTNYTNVQVAVNALIAALSGGSAGQVLQATSPSAVQWAAIGDWQIPSATLTYGTTDGHTFTVTTGGVDLTATIGVGARVRLTDGGVKYFIVTAITATTITLYGGQNYALTGGAITNPAFSTVKAPLGFPLDPAVWTESLTDTAANRVTASPTNAVWANPGALALAIPIGSWRVSWSAALGITYVGGYTSSVYASLSTTTNSNTDPAFGVQMDLYMNPGPAIASVYNTRDIVLAAKTTYNLVCMSDNVIASIANLGYYSTRQPTILKAVCNYL